MNKKVILQNGKEQSLLRKHPWVFSGAIKSKDDAIQDGEIVDVFSVSNKYIGSGHYHNGSISVRLFSFENVEINSLFWKQKLVSAFQLRSIVGLANNKSTNAYRLIHGEGDGFPGLIIDIYNEVAIFQAHSIGMHLLKNTIAPLLIELFEGKLKAVFDKSKETLPANYSNTIKNDYIVGNIPDNNIVIENNCKFHVDWVGGQKTGFFVDQRENRKLLQSYSQNKTVLNTFCYTGGFSVFALQGGAKEVHSVDSSKKAIELTEKNILLNSTKENNFSEKHTAFVQDTFDYLKDKSNLYDVIILDPPAFAKHQNAKHNAINGYKRLNVEAISKIKSGGILFTFSCSQVIDRKIFYGTVASAAIETGRNIRVLHHLSQPADHPVNIYHPEGEYLKGLVLYVE
ncbi:MAG: class I SAM-dependent rRNA methyltransferase [Bacteroidetes bacterium]|nr:class I SAM-dependent rRNA methyltransferase [Bacteroidota bacterium]